MSENVERQIVSMEFQNSKFNANARKSREELEKFKESMDFNSSSKSFTKALTKMTAKLTIVSKIAGNLFDDTKSFVKSISFDQISAGWSKFEDETKSVATILGNFKGNVDDVYNSLSRLSTFTDETSYDYNAMVNTISKFVSAGVDLETATNAMQGISTWAASAGKGTQEAYSVMYNLSQTLGKGYVQLQDWMSIENATMATQEFKQTLLDAGVAMGKIKKIGKDYVVGMNEIRIATEGSDNIDIRSSLKQNWLTTDVLLKALDSYGGFSNRLMEVVETYGNTSTDWIRAIDEGIENITNNTTNTKYYNKLMASLEETGITAEEVREILDELSASEYELGRESYKAAYLARTFSDAITAVKTAVSSGWSATFKKFIGDSEQASDFWTNLSNSMYNVFMEGINWRNELFDAWLELEEYDTTTADGFSAIGGRAKLIAGIENIISHIETMIVSIKQGIYEMFGDSNDLITKISDGVNLFYEWTKALSLVDDSTGTLNEKGQKFKKIGNAIGKILMTLAKFAKYLWKIITNIVDSITPSLDTILTNISSLADNVAEFIDYLISKSSISTFIRTGVYLIVQAIKLVGAAFKKLITWVTENIIPYIDTFGTIFLGALSSLNNTLRKFLPNIFGEAGEDAGSAFSEGLSTSLSNQNGLSSSVSTGALEFASQFLGVFSDVKTKFDEASTFGEGIAAAADSIMTQWNTVVSDLSQAATSDSGSITGSFGSLVISTIIGVTNTITSIMEALAELAPTFWDALSNGITIFFNNVTAFFNSIKPADLENVFTNLSDMFTKILGALVTLLSTLLDWFATIPTESLASFFQDIGSALAYIIQALAYIIIETASWIKAIPLETWSQIVDFIMTMVINFTTSCKAIWDFIVSFYNTNKAMFDMVNNCVQFIFNAISGIFKSVIEKGSAMSKGAGIAIVVLLSVVGVVIVIFAIFRRLLTGFNSIKNALTDMTRSFKAKWLLEGMSVLGSTILSIAGAIFILAMLPWDEARTYAAAGIVIGMITAIVVTYALIIKTIKRLETEAAKAQNISTADAISNFAETLAYDYVDAFMQFFLGLSIMIAMIIIGMGYIAKYGTNWQSMAVVGIFVITSLIVTLIAFSILSKKLNYALAKVTDAIRSSITSINILTNSIKVDFKNNKMIGAFKSSKGLSFEFILLLVSIGVFFASVSKAMGSLMSGVGSVVSSFSNLINAFTQVTDEGKKLIVSEETLTTIILAIAFVLTIIVVCLMVLSNSLTKFAANVKTMISSIANTPTLILTLILGIIAIISIISVVALLPSISFNPLKILSITALITTIISAMAKAIKSIIKCIKKHMASGNQSFLPMQLAAVGQMMLDIGGVCLMITAALVILEPILLALIASSEREQIIREATTIVLGILASIIGMIISFSICIKSLSATTKNLFGKKMIAYGAISAYVTLIGIMITTIILSLSALFTSISEIATYAGPLSAEMLNATEGIMTIIAIIGFLIFFIPKIRSQLDKFVKLTEKKANIEINALKTNFAELIGSIAAICMILLSTAAIINSIASLADNNIFRIIASVSSAVLLVIPTVLAFIAIFIDFIIPSFFDVYKKISDQLSGINGLVTYGTTFTVSINKFVFFMAAFFAAISQLLLTISLLSATVNIESGTSMALFVFPSLVAFLYIMIKTIIPMLFNLLNDIQDELGKIKDIHQVMRTFGIYLIGFIATIGVLVFLISNAIGQLKDMDPDKIIAAGVALTMITVAIFKYLSEVMIIIKMYQENIIKVSKKASIFDKLTVSNTLGAIVPILISMGMMLLIISSAILLMSDIPAESFLSAAVVILSVRMLLITIIEMYAKLPIKKLKTFNTSIYLILAFITAIVALLAVVSESLPTILLTSIPVLLSLVVVIFALRELIKSFSTIPIKSINTKTLSIMLITLIGIIGTIAIVVAAASGINSVGNVVALFAIPIIVSLIALCTGAIFKFIKENKGIRKDQYKKMLSTFGILTLIVGAIISTFVSIALMTNVAKFDPNTNGELVLIMTTSIGLFMGTFAFIKAIRKISFTATELKNIFMVIAILASTIGILTAFCWSGVLLISTIKDMKITDDIWGNVLSFVGVLATLLTGLALLGPLAIGASVTLVTIAASLLPLAAVLALFILCIKVLGNESEDGLTKFIDNICIVINAIPKLLNTLFLALVRAIPTIILIVNLIIDTLIIALTDRVIYIAERIIQAVFKIIDYVNVMLPQIHDYVLKALVILFEFIGDIIYELSEPLINIVVAVFDVLGMAFDRIDVEKALKSVGVLNVIFMALSTLLLSGVTGMLGALVLWGISAILSQVGILLQPFFEFLDKLDPSIIDKFRTLSEFMAVVLSGSELAGIDPLISLKMLTLFTSFGAALVLLGTNLIIFNAMTKNIDTLGMGNLLTGVANLMTSVANVPVGFLAGATIKSFSSQLGSLGRGLVEFSDAVAGGFNKDAVDAAAAASGMLTALWKNLPRTPGFFESLIVGTPADLQEFINTIPLLGQGMKAFSDSLTDSSGKTTIKSDVVEAAINGATMIAGVYEHLPNTGGLAQWASGTKDLSGFSNAIGGMGANIMSFYNSFVGENGNFNFEPGKFNYLMAVLQGFTEFSGKFAELNTSLLEAYKYQASLQNNTTDAVLSPAKSFGDIGKFFEALADSMPSFIGAVYRIITTMRSILSGRTVDQAVQDITSYMYFTKGILFGVNGNPGYIDAIDWYITMLQYVQNREKELRSLNSSYGGSIVTEAFSFLSSALGEVAKFFYENDLSGIDLERLNLYTRIIEGLFKWATNWKGNTINGAETIKSLIEQTLNDDPIVIRPVFDLSDLRNKIAASDFSSAYAGTYNAATSAKTDIEKAYGINNEYNISGDHIENHNTFTFYMSDNVKDGQSMYNEFETLVKSKSDTTNAWIGTRK